MHELEKAVVMLPRASGLSRLRPPAERVAAAQGLYYVVTGVWPLVSLGSFVRVTGPKADGWLVKTVAALVSVIGLALLHGARRRRVTPELQFLGAGSALALATIDAVYTSSRRIAAVYLGDAAAELALAAGWAAARR